MFSASQAWNENGREWKEKGRTRAVQREELLLGFMILIIIMRLSLHCPAWNYFLRLNTSKHAKLLSLQVGEVFNFRTYIKDATEL